MDQSNIVNHHQFTPEGNPVTFTPGILAKVKALIARYPEGRQQSALLPVLHIAQEELGGHLSVDIMDYVASLLGIQPIEVYEVATFYSMFYLDNVGKYVIEVCRTGPCALSGGEEILNHLKESLQIDTGQTTPDGLFTLKEVECLGSCGTGPVIQVNTEFHEKLTAAKVDRLLEDLKAMANENRSGDSSWAEQFS
jgi:NADH-quinone oxidoreductase subunit E